MAYTQWAAAQEYWDIVICVFVHACVSLHTCGSACLPYLSPYHSVSTHALCICVYVDVCEIFCVCVCVCVCMHTSLWCCGQ